MVGNEKQLRKEIIVGKTFTESQEGFVALQGLRKEWAMRETRKEERGGKAR